MAGKQYRIYKITNSKGKSYIGLTSQTIQVRKLQHFRKAWKESTYNHPFYNAIRKYGKDDFTVTLVKDNLTLEQANKEESEQIAFYGLSNLYNLSKGGDHDASDGGKLFWERIRADSEAYKTYIANLKASLQGRDPKCADPLKKYWRDNPRKFYEHRRRMTRLAAKVNKLKHVHLPAREALTLKETLIRKHKPELWRSITIKKGYAERNNEDARNTAISKGKKEYWDNLKSDPVAFQKHKDQQKEKRYFDPEKRLTDKAFRVVTYDIINAGPKNRFMCSDRIVSNSAGRLIQLQNLPQNHIADLQGARDMVAYNDYDLLTTVYDDASSILSQLIRTAFIAPEGMTFSVADFSAIEARVIARLAGEQWRLDVFATHGKIYEASASMMFGVPIGSVTKGSDLRQKGKVAELALGYQGAVGALAKMGGEKMGLSVEDMTLIVKKWREANPAIVGLWKNLETCAVRCIKTGKTIESKHWGLTFAKEHGAMTILLPSGRKLFYRKPSLTENKWGQETIRYKGMDQTTKQWVWVDSYGGKLTENVVQAIARDLLFTSMLRLREHGFKIVMHVHDEVVCEIPKDDQDDCLARICKVMGEPIPWAEGLVLTADGYNTEYYKKD